MQAVEGVLRAIRQCRMLDHMAHIVVARRLWRRTLIGLPVLFVDPPLALGDAVFEFEKIARAKSSVRLLVWRYITHSGKVHGRSL